MLSKEVSEQNSAEIAHALKTSLGVEYVLLKGGHSLAHDQRGCDYLALDSSTQGIYYQAKAVYSGDVRGTGCSLATSIAAILAKGEEITEAICLAKYHLTEQMDIATKKWTDLGVKHLPYYGSSVSDKLCYLPNVSLQTVVQKSFVRMPHSLGFYPVVDHVDWLEILAKLGIKTIQLRLKNLSQIELESQIKKASGIAREYHLSLFINDHWQLAINYQCFGVHLGQEDLETADLLEIAKSGLRLGVSTHNYVELACALTLKPSYIAFGPIYPTTTKEMRFGDQGLVKLKIWRKLCQEIPLVAIGGIFERQMPDVWGCDVDGVAVVSYITKAQDVQKAVTRAQYFEQIALGNYIEYSI